MEASAYAFTREGLPRGCMVSLGGTHRPPGLASVCDDMGDLRSFGEASLFERPRQGIGDGDMSPAADVEGPASFLEATLHGMAVKAHDRVSLERLLTIGRIAMKAWPISGEDRARD